MAESKPVPKPAAPPPPKPTRRRQLTRQEMVERAERNNQEVQAIFDETNAQGFFGLPGDPEPNSAYTAPHAGKE